VRRIGTAFAVPDPAQHLFAVANFQRGVHLVYSCGYWDNSVVCSNLSDGNTLASSLEFHKDVCTCIAVDTQSYRYLVTGSADTTVLVWEIGKENHQAHDNCGLQAPVHTLYGHDKEVTCVAINCAMNMIVSGSSDGTLMIHDMRGRYVRSIYIPNKRCVKSFVVSQLGSIFVLTGAASSDAASSMHHYSANGRRIHSDTDAGEGVNCMLM
jgi:WD40 repeat protein